MSFKLLVLFMTMYQGQPTPFAGANIPQLFPSKAMCETAGAEVAKRFAPKLAEILKANGKKLHSARVVCEKSDSKPAPESVLPKIEEAPKTRGEQI